MAADKGANQSVEKAISVLESFASGEPMRVGDVARAAGIGQSTASRLLATLEAGGLVERDAQTTLYFLGSESADAGRHRDQPEPRPSGRSPDRPGAGGQARGLGRQSRAAAWRRARPTSATSRVRSRPSRTP